MQTQNQKRFTSRDGVGKAKYTVSYYDGIQTHKDGSPFWGMAIFKNKVKRDGFLKELKDQSYIEGRG